MYIISNNKLVKQVATKEQADKVLANMKNIFGGIWTVVEVADMYEVNYSK